MAAPERARPVMASSGVHACLVALNEDGRNGRRRVIVMAHAGAGVAPFTDWPARVESGTVLYAVRMPGRESRLKETPHSSISAMADELAESVSALPPLPTALYGHCLGALVVYETARRLEPAGVSIERLTVSSHAAPLIHSERRPERTKVSGLPSEEFWSAIREYGGVAEELFEHPALLRLLEPSLRSDWRAADSYVFEGEAELSVPISGVLGDEDPIVTVDDIEAWSACTSAGFQFVEVRGGHFLLAGEGLDIDELRSLATRPTAPP